MGTCCVCARGKRSLPWSEPRKSPTHPSQRNPGSATPPSRGCRRGRLRSPPPFRADSPACVALNDPLRRPPCASGLVRPVLPRGRPAASGGRRRASPFRSSRATPATPRTVPARKLTRSVRPARAGCKLAAAQALGIFGEPSQRRGPMDRLAGARPRSVGAPPGRMERKVFSCSAAAAVRRWPTGRSVTAEQPALGIRCLGQDTYAVPGSIIPACSALIRTQGYKDAERRDLPCI